MSKDDEEDYVDISLGAKHPKPKSLATLYEYYISGAITGPEDYVEVFDQIRNARRDDEVRVHINSYGGDLYTAIQFMRVFGETDALVTASIEGACMSAATLLFLSAHAFEISPHSSFMVHTYSGGTFGKGSDMHAQLNHEKQWSEKLFKSVYRDFLTEKEITEILEGKDYWMDVEEVAERMNKRIATRKEMEELEKATTPDKVD